MLKGDRVKFKQRLLELRGKVQSGLSDIAKENLNKSSRDAAGDLSGYSIHMADMGTDNYDRDFVYSLATSKQEKLFEIDEALKRLEEKTYGKCEKCDKDIGVKRLEVRPVSRYCVKCKSEMEKKR